MSIKSQGSELFIVDNFTTPATPAIVKLKCPTGITGLGGARDQIENTCLDATEDRTYVSGLGNPGQVSVPFNLDPSAVSHQLLFDMKESGANTQFVIGFSDGTATPTIVTNTVTTPTGRTTAVFTAYVADVNIDIATNTIVTGTLTLQRSGAVNWTWKA